MNHLNDSETFTLSNTYAVTASRFMSKVYSWMTVGIALTGVIAFQVSQSDSLVEFIVMNRAVFWGLIIAQLGAVFYLNLAMKRISVMTATSIYLLYAALTGVTLSLIFRMYTTDSIAGVFGVTAFSFAGLSAFGFVTKKDLGPIGSFCSMGLFGMIGFALMSLIFPSIMGGVSMQVYSTVGIIVFAGLTAYDTQKIKAIGMQSEVGSDSYSKAAVFGALTLYLDFINLFLNILRLAGRRK